MRSASPRIARALALGATCLLVAGAASGCETTQEKAQKQQAEAKRILDARAKRQERKKKAKQNGDGQKAGSGK